MTAHIATVAFQGIGCRPVKTFLLLFLLCGLLAACSFTETEASEEDIEEAAVAAMLHDYRSHGFRPVPDSRRCIRYYVGSADGENGAANMRNFSPSSRKKLLEALGSALPDEQCHDPLARNNHLYYCAYRKDLHEPEQDNGVVMGCGNFRDGAFYLVRKSFWAFQIDYYGGWTSDNATPRPPKGR